MNLKEWLVLDTQGKIKWLNAQSQHDLEHILAIVGEMLESAADLEAEVSMLPYNEELNTAQESTNSALRDMEKCIVDTLIRLRNEQCNRSSAALKECVEELP
jgi:cell division GTPase FtsZ